MLQGWSNGVSFFGFCFSGEFLFGFSSSYANDSDTEENLIEKAGTEFQYLD